MTSTLLPHGRLALALAIALTLAIALVGGAACQSKGGSAGKDPAPGEATPASPEPRRPGARPKTPVPDRPLETTTPTPRPAPLGENVIREPVLWGTAEAVAKGCEQRIQAAQALLTQILAVKGARTMENTLVPFNQLLTELDRTLPLAELTSNVHPEKAVRTAAETCEQTAKKWLSQLKLNRPMYEALGAVEAKGLETQAARFQRLFLRDYRRAGVDRDPATREKLAKLDAEMVKLGQDFARNIREDKRYLEVTEKELEGLPEDFLKARRKPGAKIRLTTDTTDFFPVESYARSEALRKALYLKYLGRAFPANARVLGALLKARHAYATTLGYPDWAQYAAEDKMVKQKQVVADFIERVATLARPKMEADLKEILARKKKDVPGAERVGKWDRFYYVKKIQEERFGVKPDEVRAYFDFPKVKAGLLRIGGQLAGVEFKHVPGAKVWHPQVEAWDMLEEGVPRARLYLDLHPREGKYGHAALFPITSGVSGVQLPSAALVTNFPDPAKTKGGPALMEHNQVTTFFHEFGHLLHQLLAGRHRWVTQSGITCEWDFVEAPSQLLEEWAWDPAVLATFAVHHQTGERIPAALVRKMRAAEEFGKGVHVMRQMYYAALSFQYHARDPKGLDLLGLQKELQQKYSPFPWEPGTTTYASFGHLQGYSSMYYTYMWSLVLSKDLFTRFERSSLMHADTALALRREILEPGGARDAEDLVKAFLGRPHTFDAYQKWLAR